MGIAHAKKIDRATRIKRDTERRAIACLPKCPGCRGKFTTEDKAIRDIRMAALVFGSDLGHIDAVCFRCMVGVSVKGSADYKTGNKVTTPPASYGAYRTASRLFGKHNLFLFYGNAKHNIFLNYAESLVAAKVTYWIRPHGGIQKRVALKFAV